MTHPHPEPQSQENLWEEAMTDPPKIFFGMVTFRPWKCALIKGKGKVPYDAQVHGGNRYVAVDIVITPIDTARYMIQKTEIANKQRFMDTIRPSIERLAPRVAEMKGLQMGQFDLLEEASGMYIRGEWVPATDNKPGQTWKTLCFTDVYTCEDECAAAYQAHQAERGIADSAAPTPTANDDKRVKAALFLPLLWAQAGGQGVMTTFAKATAVEKLAELITTNSTVAEHFTMESPEVKAIVDTIEEQEDIPF